MSNNPKKAKVLKIDEILEGKPFLLVTVNNVNEVGISIDMCGNVEDNEVCMLILKAALKRMEQDADKRRFINDKDI